MLSLHSSYKQTRKSTTDYRFNPRTIVTVPEIVGWTVGPTLDTKYPVMALGMALKRLEGISRSQVKLVHHSDRGVQYASSQYVNLLIEHGIRISMTETGDPKHEHRRGH